MDSKGFFAQKGWCSVDCQEALENRFGFILPFEAIDLTAKHLIRDSKRGINRGQLVNQVRFVGACQCLNQRLEILSLFCSESIANRRT